MLDLSRNLRQKLLDLGVEATEQVGVGDEANRAVDLQLVGFEADEVLLKLRVGGEGLDLLGKFGAGGTRGDGRGCNRRLDDRRLDRRCSRRFDHSLDDSRRLRLLGLASALRLVSVRRAFDDGGRGTVAGAGGRAAARRRNESVGLHSLGEAVDGLDEWVEEFFRDVDGQFHGCCIVWFVGYFRRRDSCEREKGLRGNFVVGFEKLFSAFVGDSLEHLLVGFMMPDDGGRDEAATPVPEVLGETLLVELEGVVGGFHIHVSSGVCRALAIS